MAEWYTALVEGANADAKYSGCPSSGTLIRLLNDEHLEN